MATLPGELSAATLPGELSAATLLGELSAATLLGELSAAILLEELHNRFVTHPKQMTRAAGGDPIFWIPPRGGVGKNN